ncbi:MAG TPA: hypothetical protein VF290_09655 [Pyrinomonadaceae bacterium]
MQTRKIVLTLSVAIAAIAIAIAGLSAQTAKSGQANALKVKEDKLSSVNFDAPGPGNANEKARRNARGKRFDGSLRVAEPHPEAGAKGILDSWMQSLPALPVAASDAIVVGEITNAQAYLSPDKTGVYTEYTVRVDEVLKQSSAAPVAGGLVDVQREGGRVQFPSGRVQSYVTHYQGVPVTGQRYVLFLKRNEQADVFIILTGYEQRDGKVYPLDGVDLPQGASELPQFAAYKGVGEATFSKDLRGALAHPE